MRRFLCWLLGCRCRVAGILNWNLPPGFFLESGGFFVALLKGRGGNSVVKVVDVIRSSGKSYRIVPCWRV